MNSFTGFEYLLIDCANQLDNQEISDKNLFEERIQWGREHINCLEAYVDEAAEPELFTKAVMAVRKAQKHEPMGHMVGLDAICSGLQIMGACLRDYNACFFTGLLDSGARPDAYTETTKTMGIMGIKRKDVKYATMTHFYGSRAKPKELFPDVDVLGAFYKAMDYIAPLPNQLRNLLIGTWDSNALAHQWVLPDGHLAYVPSIVEKKIEPEIPELGKKFTHYIKVNEAQEYSVSNAANVVHSLDALLVREMDRACNYDPEAVNKTVMAIHNAMPEKHFAATVQHPLELAYCNSGYLSMKCIEEVGRAGTAQFTKEFCLKTLEQVEIVEQYRSFPMVSNHDEFKCHANHCNRMRWWYREFLARFAEANIIEDIYQQLTGDTLPLQKGSVEAKWIRESVYTLS